MFTVMKSICGTVDHFGMMSLNFPTDVLNYMKKIKIDDIKDMKLDFTATCDLCGHQFIAVHKFPSMKADCPNCKNEVYTNAFD